MENFFSILGGMGTMATESFVRQINHRITAHRDQDYLNYVLFNHATMPDRTAYILDKNATNPMPFLLDDIAQQNLLKPEFIVLTCNTAHYFFDELQAATPIEILHMPREAAKELGRRGEKGARAAFLGTEGSVRNGIYEKELTDAGFTVVIPKEKLQEKVTRLIYHDIKERDFLNRDLYCEILEDAFKAYECEYAVLGCTELSLVAEVTHSHESHVIDAQSILADRTIERALANREK